MATEVPVLNMEEATDKITAPPAQIVEVVAGKPKKHAPKPQATFSNRCGCSGLIATCEKELLVEEIYRLREILRKARSESLAQETTKPKGFS